MKDFKYTIDGNEYKVTIASIDENNVADVIVNDESYKVQLEKEAEPVNKKVTLGQPTEESSSTDSTISNINVSNAIKAPLPGTITQILVEVGQDVKTGDTLLVLEAMKMANNIEAETDGKVTAICVKPGQAVLEEDALVVIE